MPFKIIYIRHQCRRSKQAEPLDAQEAFHLLRKEVDPLKADDVMQLLLLPLQGLEGIQHGQHLHHPHRRQGECIGQLRSEALA